MKSPKLIAVIVALLLSAAGLWTAFRDRESKLQQSKQPTYDSSGSKDGLGHNDGDMGKPSPSGTVQSLSLGQPMVTTAKPAIPNELPGTLSGPSSHQPPTEGAAAVPVLAPWQSPLGGNVELEKQVDKIKLMLRDFRTLMGENPVGTNLEIMKAIVGANPKGAKLGPPEGMPLSGSGELVDPWGTPYFFHQLSGSQMEIRSAGQDRKMWTEDDIILK